MFSGLVSNFKALFYTLFAITLGIALVQFEYNSRFLASEFLYNNIYIIVLVNLAIIGIIGFFYRQRLQNKVSGKYGKRAGFSTQLRLIFAPLSILAIGCFLFFFTFKIAPHLYTLAFGNNGVMIATVKTHKNANNCRDGLKFQERILWSSQICNVDTSVLSEAENGTLIRVEGKKSWAGIIPDKLAIVQEIELDRYSQDPNKKDGFFGFRGAIH